jgi:hypothetical protein
MSGVSLENFVTDKQCATGLVGLNLDQRLVKLSECCTSYTINMPCTNLDAIVNKIFEMKNTIASSEKTKTTFYTLKITKNGDNINLAINHHVYLDLSNSIGITINKLIEHKHKHDRIFYLYVSNIIIVKCPSNYKGNNKLSKIDLRRFSLFETPYIQVSGYINDKNEYHQNDLITVGSVMLTVFGKSIHAPDDNSAESLIKYIKLGRVCRLKEKIPDETGSLFEILDKKISEKLNTEKSDDCEYSEDSETGKGPEKGNDPEKSDDSETGKGPEKGDDSSDEWDDDDWDEVNPNAY